MLNLMEWHFSVQDGMYFDKRNETQSHIVFSSNNVTGDGTVNFAILKNGISLKDEIEIIERSFNDIQRSPCIYLSNDENYEQWSQFLEQRGYSILLEESFMSFDKKNIDIKSKVDLNTIRATDAKSARDFIDIYISAFAEPPYEEGLAKPYVDSLLRTLNNNDKFFNFVCYEGEMPVSIASLCFYDGKGGIYSVGTTPSVRSKGFGTVAIKTCIDKWQELKGTELFLQTETGSTVEKWYQRLGFKTQFTGRYFSKES